DQYLHSFPTRRSSDLDKYDLFINLRHTAYYPYSNFSFGIKQKGLGIQDSSAHFDIKLAETDGRWIGASAGNLYEQTKLLQETFRSEEHTSELQSRENL